MAIAAIPDFVLGFGLLYGYLDYCFVLSDPFLCCFWIIVQLEGSNMAHYKISNGVSHLLIFYLLVFD